MTAPLRGPLALMRDVPPPPPPEWAASGPRGANGVGEVDDMRELAEGRNPAGEASDQIADAALAIDRRPETFLRMPWGALDDLVEGIPPADVWYVVAFSGQGKTLFTSSALDRWYEAGKRVYVLGLESQPHVLRTHWACKRVGVDAGDLLTGKVHALPNGAAIRDAVRAELMSQSRDDKSRVYFSPVKFIDLNALARAARHAAAWGADVLIIDHVDHIRAGDGRSGFSESQAVQHRILELAQHHGHRMLVASQLNNDAVRGDALAMHRPPRPEHVFMGSVKRQVASGMIGLYKPLREPMPGESPKEYDAALSRVRRHEAEPHTVVQQGVMGVVVMKHRARGAHEGRRCLLGVTQGKVVDLPPRDQGTALTPAEMRNRR